MQWKPPMANPMANPAAAMATVANVVKTWQQWLSKPTTKPVVSNVTSPLPQTEPTPEPEPVQPPQIFTPQQRPWYKAFPFMSSNYTAPDGSVTAPQGTTSNLNVPRYCRRQNTQDEGRPVPEVLKEHPEKLGYCHFGYVNDNLAVCAANMMSRHYDFDAKDYFGFHINNELPRHDVNYDGGHFTTTMNWENNKESIFDDLYCHANGWLMNQGLPVQEIKHTTVWEGLAELECEKIQKQDFHEQELTIASMKYLQVRETSALAWHEAGATVPMPTKRDMQRHAAVKCALGGVACDMAACSKLGCLQPDGFIARGEMCQKNIPQTPPGLQLPVGKLSSPWFQ